MAISLSVTVSIGDEIYGALRYIFLVRRVRRSTSFTAKLMNPGSMLKSLKR